jgi:hypothetical protein
MLQFCSRLLCCRCCARVQIDHKHRRYIEQALNAVADILQKPEAHDYIHDCIDTMRSCDTFYDTMALVRNCVRYLADFHQVAPAMLMSPCTSPHIKKHVSDAIDGIHFITGSGIVDQTAILHIFIMQTTYQRKLSLTRECPVQTQLIAAALHIILNNSGCTLNDLLRIHRDMLPAPTSRAVVEEDAAPKPTEAV